MMSIKQIKSDTSGPIIYQGATRLERSSDFIWDNAIKELQINGNIKLGGDVLIYNDTFNAGNQITKVYCADGAGIYDVNLVNTYEYAVSVNSQTLVGNIRIFSTNPLFEGATYNADYSANFVNESLVTKRYVDSVAGSTYTFNNGITNTLGTVQLGGALIQDTIVDGATNAWSMTFSNIKQFVAGQTRNEDYECQTRAYEYNHLLSEELREWKEDLFKPMPAPSADFISVAT